GRQILSAVNQFAFACCRYQEKKIMTRCSTDNARAMYFWFYVDYWCGITGRGNRDDNYLRFSFCNAKAKPEIIIIPVTPARYAAPIVNVKPEIHGARIIGATPGHDFLFLIPATGKGKLVYGAKNLPAGLTVNAQTGVISGKLQSA